MLILILIDVHYSQKVVFSFEKSSNRQNHISSGFFYLVENLLHQNFWFPSKSSSNPVKSKSVNQSKIRSEFQRCTYNPFINYYLFSLEFQKKLQRTCPAGSSVPKPLKLTRKIPEQHVLCCPCAFYVDFEQIYFTGFHAYLTYLTNSCFHCFEQVNTIWERF